MQGSNVIMYNITPEKTLKSTMKGLFTVLFLSLLITSARAQDVYSSSGKPLRNDEKDVKSDKLIDPDRLIFGGWGVFGIGSGVTNVGITPIIGYRITEEFSAGIGFGYQYLRVKDYYAVIVDPNTGAQEGRPLNAHFYSPSVWMRYRIWNNIFAHVEYEQNISNVKEYTNDFTQFPPPIITRKTTLSVPSLLVGGGLRQPVGERASIIFMVLYDVLQEPNSPYLNTVAIRFGVNFGF